MKVAFYKGTRPGLQGIYSRIVRLIDRGPYSHCELVFDSGLCASASYIDGGVRFKQIDFDPAKWDFIEVPWADPEKAFDWFSKHAGEPYDLAGNLHFVFGVVPDGKGRWFCSEAVAAAMGLPEAWRFGPNGLAALLTFLEDGLVHA